MEHQSSHKTHYNLAPPHTLLNRSRLMQTPHIPSSFNSCPNGMLASVWCDCVLIAPDTSNFKYLYREVHRRCTFIKMFKDQACSLSRARVSNSKLMPVMSPSVCGANRTTKTAPPAGSVIFDLSLVNWGGLTSTRDGPWGQWISLLALRGMDTRLLNTSAIKSCFLGFLLLLTVISTCRFNKTLLSP